MERQFNLFVQDILDSIKNIEEFVGNMSFDDFCGDEKTKSAVVLKIEVIGEAARNIPKEIKAQYKDIPWKDMVGMRNKISHFYFGIDYKIVWKVIKERLPGIKPEIDRILKDLEEKKR